MSNLRMLSVSILPSVRFLAPVRPPPLHSPAGAPSATFCRCSVTSPAWGGADDSPLLTVEQVAQLLAVRPALVRVLAHRGELPYRRIGEMLLRFRAEDVEAYVRGDRQPRRGRGSELPRSPASGSESPENDHREGRETDCAVPCAAKARVSS
jgi:excisionase family DNA binding protein